MDKSVLIVHSYRVLIQQMEVWHLTRNLSVVSLSPIKGYCGVLDQQNLPTLLSTGWFQVEFMHDNTFSQSNSTKLV